MSRQKNENGLRLTLRSYKRYFIVIGVASALVNVLYLTGSFFMLEVYDRVIPSRSVPSLVALCVIALMLYMFQGAFDVLRGRMLVRISSGFDESFGNVVFYSIFSNPLKNQIDGDGLQPVRDFDQVKSYLSGGGPPALLDLPWMPLYIFICFLFHPWLGYLAIFGGLFLVFITYLTDRGTRTAAMETAQAGGSRMAFAQASQRNAEVMRAMGMRDSMSEIWESKSKTYRDLHKVAWDVGNGFGAISKVFRMALQSGVLAAGAILVIEGQASAGIIIAGSILISRALAPLEMTIGHWRGFLAARQSWGRLQTAIAALPAADSPLSLPAPHKQLSVQGLTGGPPGAQRLTFGDVNFTIEAGSGLGIIGPSGSGKSSLARALIGVWPTFRGSVRLDGAALNQWAVDDLGKHIGYLPQDVELFSGTVAQNIARFEKNMQSAAVVAAARAARVNELILSLPKGYETEIGEGGSALSAGQRQRIALARALYRDPFLVVLDEPNSNLDAEGEQALTEAITGIRARGGIAIVIAHRPSALASSNMLLMMRDGRMENFGSKDQVLGQVLQRAQLDRPSQLKLVEGQEASSRIISEREPS